MIDALWSMKTNEFIPGGEIAKIRTELSKADVAVKRVTRVNEGLKVDLTWIGNTLARDLKDGAIIKVERIKWPDGNSVLKIMTSNFKVKFDGKLISPPIYINNNGYAKDIVVPTKYVPILKGKW